MKEIVIIDGVKYDAETYGAGPQDYIWVVRKFNSFSSADNPGEDFMEADLWPPRGKFWTARDAVEAAIKKQHWM
jgi:hypothetical protein